MNKKLEDSLNLQIGLFKKVSGKSDFSFCVYKARDFLRVCLGFSDCSNNDAPYHFEDFGFDSLSDLEAEIRKYLVSNKKYTIQDVGFFGINLKKINGKNT